MKADFYAIDFETANENLDSACSIGIVGVKNERIIEEIHYYFHPHQNFSEFNISIHHITPQMVYGLGGFDTIWNEIYPYFDETVIVCHNAFFDMNVLKALVEKYHLQKPNIKFVCTYRMSDILWDYSDGFLNHRLDTLARYLDIDFNHHDALDDARVCALAASRIMKIEQASTLIEASKKLFLAPGVYNKDRFFPTYKIDFLFAPINDRFVDKVFCFSGVSPFKKKIIEEIKKCGGMIDKTLRDNCDYFILLNDYDVMKLTSAKRKKYIKILTEMEILEMLYDN